METILIKVAKRSKAKALVEMLSSLDFVDNVTYVEKLQKAKAFFDLLNKQNATSPLKQMTMKDIDKEVKAVRNAK